MTAMVLFAVVFKSQPPHTKVSQMETPEVRNHINSPACVCVCNDIGATEWADVFKSYMPVINSSINFWLIYITDYNWLIELIII